MIIIYALIDLINLRLGREMYNDLKPEVLSQSINQHS